MEDIAFTPRAPTRDNVVAVRLNDAELAEAQDLAARYGKTPSEMVREGFLYALKVDKQPLPADSGLVEPPKVATRAATSGKRGNLAKLASRPQG